MSNTLTPRERQLVSEAYERAAVLAENWGNAPANPRGRRAELARAIRALKEAK